MPWNESDELQLMYDFAKSLDTLPGVSAEVIQDSLAKPDPRIDGLVRCVINNVASTLVVEVKRRTLFPRDIPMISRQLRNALAHAKTANPDLPVVPVLLADTISAGAREALHDERMGYWDLSESLYLPSDQSYILIEKPLDKKQEKTITTVFEGQRSLVLHALWELEGWVSGAMIANKSDVSPATVSETLSELERRGWIETAGAGPAKVRRLVNASEILDAWTDYQRSKKPPEVQRYYLTSNDLDDVVDRVGQAFDDVQPYEITGQLAGQTYAAYLTHVSQVMCRCYKPKVVGSILASLGAKRVSEGWNLGIIEASTSNLPFRRRMGDAYFASPLQTFLDLLQQGGRSKELAENLRRMQLNSR